MHTFGAALDDLLTRFTYKPDMELVVPEYDSIGRPTLQVRHTTPNARTPEHEVGLVVHRHAIPTLPPPSDEYVLRWLRTVLLRTETHELDEWFKVDGRMMHDPHTEGMAGAWR